MYWLCVHYYNGAHSMACLGFSRRSRVLLRYKGFPLILIKHPRSNVKSRLTGCGPSGSLNVKVCSVCVAQQFLLLVLSLSASSVDLLSNSFSMTHEAYRNTQQLLESGVTSLLRPSASSLSSTGFAGPSSCRVSAERAEETHRSFPDGGSQPGSLRKAVSDQEDCTLKSFLLFGVFCSTSS